MANQRVGGGGGGRRTGGGQGRSAGGYSGGRTGTGRGGPRGTGATGASRGAGGAREASRGASTGPRQPRAMKRGGFSPAPEFGKKREGASTGTPRWSDIPEHKSKRPGPDRREPASRGGEAARDFSRAGRESSPRKGEFAPPRREYSRPGSPKREYSRSEGPKREYSRVGRGAAPGRPARRETGDKKAEFGRFKPAPGFEKPEKDKFSPESFVSPQAEEGIVAGINPVLELLRSGERPIDSVYIDKDKGGSQFEQMVALARQRGVSVRVVPRAALEKMAFGVRHQGAVATVPPKEYADPYELANHALSKGKSPLLLILDGVEDPQNLGAIIRTAEGAGADGVIIPEHRAAHLTGAVSRASAGALEHIPVAKVPNLANYMDFLKEKGFWTIGLSGEATEDYDKPDLTVPLAVVLGGEGAGIRPIIKKSCDMLVRLPMFGKVSSLNVSVAAGIILYEIIRQRAMGAAK